MKYRSFLIRFLLIAITYYLINEPFIDDRVNFYLMVEWWGKLAGYLVQLIATLVLVTLFIYTKRVVRYLFLILFLINSLFYLTFYKSVGTYLTFSDLITLLSAKGKIDDAIAGYGDQLLVALLIHIPFVIVYLWPVTIRFKWRGSLTLSACYLLVLFSYTLSLLNTQGRGLIGRPGFMLPTVQFALYTYVNGKNSDVNEALKPRERSDFREFVADSREINTVIMTIDESINWDLIDLNYNGDVTPSLLSYPDKNIVNFGKSVSYANCSDLSNASIRKFVRYGEEERDLLGADIVYIWEVAKQAGFVPYLIDAQANGVGHNYFTKAETDNINIIKVDDENDAELIDLIVEMRDRYPEQKQFYLVIKQGAHLPYYKEGIENYFLPVMQNASLSQASRNEIINTYKNRARFETDNYFKAIAEKLPYQDHVVVIYTSDHGQTFDMPGDKSFHCDTRNPDIKEGIVPLLIIGPETFIKSQLINDIASNNNIKSHYYIPAFIMHALGYQDDDIAKFTEYPILLEEGHIPHFTYDRAVPFFENKAEKKSIEIQEIESLSPQF